MQLRNHFSPWHTYVTVTIQEIFLAVNYTGIDPAEQLCLVIGLSEGSGTVHEMKGVFAPVLICIVFRYILLE